GPRRHDSVAADQRKRRFPTAIELTHRGCNVASESSQKTIGRNNPPRVHIVTEKEDYGSPKGVELPFVMGVLGDFSGASAAEQPDVEDREFADIDGENFDACMREARPRVVFNVPNRLEDAPPKERANVHVDLTFATMADFEPDRIAERTPGLKDLFEARRRLQELLAYLDGNPSGAKLVRQILADKNLAKSLADLPLPKKTDAPK